MKAMFSRSEFDLLFEAAYEELRRLAARVRAQEAGQTLNPTALVNEAYLRLLPSLPPCPESPLHFRRIVVRAMRRVLVDAARRRKAAKRGGDPVLVTFDEAGLRESASVEEVIALDEMLRELETLNPRQARLVELRCFGGLTLREIADELEISESAVDREWRGAKAWLSLRLRQRS
jgi:RNA polymerase sigma factor (TIGR02999 family)